MQIEINNIKKRINIDHTNDQTSIIDKLVELLNKDIVISKKKLNDKKKETLYSSLVLLLSSGIDIKTSFELIIEGEELNKEKVFLKEIYNSIIMGSSLSEAFDKTGLFSNYEIYSLKIGEESGKINEVINELWMFFKKKINQRKNIINALSYPIIVLVTAFFSVIFMLTFVVPMFMDIFTRFKGELPAITKTIIFFSIAIKSYWYIIVILLSIVVGSLYILKDKNYFRKLTSNFVLKIPFLNPLIKKIYISRFCHAMALLMAANTPMIQALRLVKKMINFFPFEAALKNIEENVLLGKPLYESFAIYSYLFDKKMLTLLKVGEETKQLPEVFDRLNIQYNQEIDYQLSMLSTFLEPILIILLGLIIGVILISMYMPLFQVSSSIL